jgi:hypothetical protein
VYLPQRGAMGLGSHGTQFAGGIPTCQGLDPRTHLPGLDPEAPQAPWPPQAGGRDTVARQARRAPMAPLGFILVGFAGRFADILEQIA